MTMANEQWQKQKKNEAHKFLLEHVQGVERLQFDTFDRFVKLAALYDPNCNRGTADESAAFISENVVASNIDTVQAAIATAEIRAVFLPVNGDWSAHRTAKHLEWYTEGLTKLHDVDTKCAVAFGKGPGVRGTGVIYVDTKGDDVTVEHVLADDMIADDRELRGGGQLRQIHRRTIVDRDDLIEEFPKHEKEIEAAYTARTGMWAGYRPVTENQIVVLRSWHFRAKRKTVTIDGCTLFDDLKWEEECPFARMVWSERDESWYGISLAERLMGHQRVLNRSNWQIDRLVDRNAVPPTYVRQTDAKLALKEVNRAGSIFVVNGEWPQTPTPPAISPEVYKRVDTVKVSASEESGVSRMASQGTKPAGLDSGVALREFKDQTTQRFATQEKAYEKFKLAVVLLMVGACKRLGKKAPVVDRQSRFGTKSIPWAKVDMRDVKVQISAAANLSRTLAGRTQLAMELAQAGIIDTDATARLIKLPDTDAELSLHNAAIEAIDEIFECIADGEIVMPEPYDNLKLLIIRAQKKYLLWRGSKRHVRAPESVLEALRQLIVQAVAIDKMQTEQAAANENMAAPAMPAAPPQSALAEQAMNLRAG